VTDAASGPGLVGRAVLVTGGARGIGLGIARGFLSAGADVLICARHTPDTLPEAAGRRASFVAGDIREAAAAAAVVDAAVDRFGRLDVVVNNAGGAPFVDAATASPALHTKIVALNLLAPLHVSQQANAVMQDQPTGGSIIMISSVSGIRPSPGAAAYGAAKAGLTSLAGTLAVEWAPKVRVNTVIVGLVATERAADHYGGADGVAAVARTIPALRMGTPQDVAEACLFLASPAAGYVSGAALTVHGGGERPAYLAAAESATATTGDS
jgi:NAD(P)-dependent dehydrogenase (short-subunit alcohol dehydrogenase family)